MGGGSAGGPLHTFSKAPPHTHTAPLTQLEVPAHRSGHTMAVVHGLAAADGHVTVPPSETSAGAGIVAPLVHVSSAVELPSASASCITSVVPLHRYP